MFTTEVSASQKAWRDKGRERYDAEKALFAHLDAYFDDPSDENLSVLQTLANTRKRLDDEARQAYREFTEEQQKARDTALSAPAPITATGSVTSMSPAVAKAMKTMDDQLRAFKEEDARHKKEELERLRRAQRPLSQKFMDWVNGK